MQTLACEPLPVKLDVAQQQKFWGSWTILMRFKREQQDHLFITMCSTYWGFGFPSMDLFEMLHCVFCRRSLWSQKTFSYCKSVVPNIICPHVLYALPPNLNVGECTCDYDENVSDWITHYCYFILEDVQIREWKKLNKYPKLYIIFLGIVMVKWYVAAKCWPIRLTPFQALTVSHTIYQVTSVSP